MTTSVIYGNAIRGQNVMSMESANPGASTDTAEVYANLTTFLTTKVTRIQSVTATGTVVNPTATFASTPASGSALLAVILRTADNVATVSMPTGWTLLSGGGTGGSRRAEIWWRRAGAAEPTMVISVNATAAAWSMTLIEYGGWATLADPVTISAATNVASSTNVSGGVNGMLTQVVGLVAGGSWTTATLATSIGSNSLLTALAAATQANVTEVVGYNNSEEAITTYTLGVARGTTRVIAGWPHNMDSDYSSFGYFVGTDQPANQFGGQLGVEFDTSPVYAANTISQVTLSMTASNSGPAWPSTATVEVFNVNATAIAKSGSNTRTLWRTPTELAALTKVATRAPGLAWLANTAYAWTSNSNFLTSIAQGGTTRILVATTEQRTGILSATQQVCNFEGASAHFLTIIHERLVTIPTVTMTVTPATPSRVVARLRTITATMTMTVGAPSRIAARFRTITTSMTVTPTVSRVASFYRTVTASMTLTPVVSRVVSFYRTITTSMSIVATVSRVATFYRTVSTTMTVTPTVSRVLTAYRTISTSMTLTPTVSRVAIYYRTITASMSITPTMSRVLTLYRTITTTLTTTPSLIATAIAAFQQYLPSPVKVKLLEGIDTAVAPGMSTTLKDASVETVLRVNP